MTWACRCDLQGGHFRLAQLSAALLPVATPAVYVGRKHLAGLHPTDPADDGTFAGLSLDIGHDLSWLFWQKHPDCASAYQRPFSGGFGERVLPVRSMEQRGLRFPPPVPSSPIHPGPKK